MFSIGEFARHGRISVRMLRHYDAIGLLGYEPEAITPVIQPLYCDLRQRMASAGVTAAGPALAYYEDTPAGDGAIVVHAAVPVAAETGGDLGFSVVDLAEVESAAAIIHHGSMDDVLSTGQALARVDRRQRVPLRRVCPRGHPGMVR
jgi:MerR family regulatory protein